MIQVVFPVAGLFRGRREQSALPNPSCVSSANVLLSAVCFVKSVCVGVCDVCVCLCVSLCCVSNLASTS